MKPGDTVVVKYPDDTESGEGEVLYVTDDGYIGVLLDGHVQAEYEPQLLELVEAA